VRGGLGRGEAALKLADLPAKLLVLGFRVEDVAAPADEVARGLQRTAGTLLEGRERLEEAALDSVKAARSRLAEIGGE
jgi:hypothetical protein